MSAALNLGRLAAGAGRGRSRRFFAVVLAALLSSGLLVGSPGAAPGDGAPSAGGGDLSPRQALALVESRRSDPAFVILDVRTPAEHADARIDGSLLLDYLAPGFRERLATLDRGKTYLVYCRTANRSRGAVDAMRELGFGNVYHLAGGIVRWRDEGLPTVRTETGGKVP